MPEAGRRPGRRSAEQREQRQDAILDAALAVFAEKGFAAARLDDVAARAGVAKGTIYLYAASKQALFEALVRRGISGPMQRIAAELPSLPPQAMIAHLLQQMRRQVLGTPRARLIRLVLTEGARFPELAAFYHREVISRGMALIRGVAERAVAQGQAGAAPLAQFPQLVVAPLLLAVLWEGLFQDIAPLDADALLQAHGELLARGMGAAP